MHKASQASDREAEAPSPPTSCRHLTVRLRRLPYACAPLRQSSSWRNRTGAHKR